MQILVLNRVYRKTIPAGWIWVFSPPSKLNDPSLSKITNISVREHSLALWAPEHFSSTKYFVNGMLSKRTQNSSLITKQYVYTLI